MCTWTRVNKRLRRESGGQTSVNGPEKLKLKFINVRDGGDGLGSGSGPLFRLLLTGAESASATASVYEVGTYCAKDSLPHRLDFLQRCLACSRRSLALLRARAGRRARARAGTPGVWRWWRRGRRRRRRRRRKRAARARAMPTRRELTEASGA